MLLTAKGIQLKVIQIMDRDRVTDTVSGLVQRRFTAEMDSVQFFVTSQKTLSTEFLHMYSGNGYGTTAGSSWPPWVPVEVMFDFSINPYGFSRVVQRTSASLRYDKYNTLRLKYNDEVSKGEDGAQSPDVVESRIDHIWIEFPQVRAICDSPQYYAMYIIVMDLLLYSEPLEKVRSERLEKIMLASDFSDLRGAPEMVTMLQDRIRQLEEIKRHFQINEKYLDQQGWEDRIAMDHDLAACEDELFFMMKAITTSQRRIDDRSQTSQSTGLLRSYVSASEIVWHLIREKEEPLMEFQLQEAAFERTDNNDGSNLNSMEISRIRGFNLLPEALYPEMIAPFFDHTRSLSEIRDTKMLRVHWYMLEAIAGIPVVDQFEVNMFPLKVQLEHEVGKRLFEYIFPGVGGNAFENGGFSPFMVKHMVPPRESEDNDRDDETKALALAPDTKRASPSQSQGTGTGTGSLEARLTPTFTLPDTRRHQATASAKSEHKYLDHFKIFQQTNRSASSSRADLTRPNGSGSAQGLGILTSPAQLSAGDLPATSANQDLEKSKRERLGLHRSTSRDEDKDKDKDKDKRSDDLTQMMTRASNYMTLAYVKIPSVVLCLSYKGKGQRNFGDVHDLVFRMPTLEYRNKTWSNLDLALHLKKDIIRALISHTGAIIGNKLSHHRPTKQQQIRLRDIASSSTILASHQDVSQIPGTEGSSIYSGPYDYRPRNSMTSSVPGSGRVSAESPSTSRPSNISNSQSQTPMQSSPALSNGSNPQSEVDHEQNREAEIDRDNLGRRLTALKDGPRKKDDTADSSDGR